MRADAAVAAAASSSASWWPPLIGVLTIITTIAVAAMNSHADDLKRAERLTAIIDKMDAGAERKIAQATRDALVSRWVLRAVAPRHGYLQALTWGLYVYGLLLIVGAAVWWIVDAEVNFWIPASLYFLGVICVIGSSLLMSKRSALRRDWLAAERSKADLRTPMYQPLMLEFERDAAAAYRLRPSAKEAPPNAPAGWYPVTGGGQRYWNGRAWTASLVVAPPPVPARNNGQSRRVGASPESARSDSR